MKTLFEQQLPYGQFIAYDELPQDTISINQTHSSIALKYLGKDLANQEGDAIVLSLDDARKKPIAIRTADCLPICLIGRSGVAMVHAGWRGLASNILGHENISSICPYYAYIGPSIHGHNFEVTSEFKDHFSKSTNFIVEESKLYFDLQAQATEQLQKLYPEIEIVDSGVCTYDTPELFSYRRGDRNLRNWNIFKFNDKD